jgi:para-nitrobenzyl esterase
MAPLSLGQAQNAKTETFVVATTAGQVRGVARAAGGAAFFGIPYAEPPVDQLRWKAPEPKKPWAGIRNATSFGAPCAQPVLGDWNRQDAEEGQEDCLYLNVIVPVWPVTQPLPVMLWLHGGANIGGSGRGALYNEGTLANHGVIVVTINYRLGIFGFFAHPELTRESLHHASGNYGLMDQILALHWVRDNIAHFGGNPENITIFGQSAGSTDVGYLMTSPLARGLFQKVIAESGAAVSFGPPPLRRAEQLGQQFASSFTVPSGEKPIAYLRGLPAQALIAKAADSPHSPITPDIDGYVLTHTPAQVFQAGNEAPVPLLIGTTSREFGSSQTVDQLRKEIENVAGQYTSPVMAAYGVAGNGQGKDDPLYGSAASQFSADYNFHCPIATEALWHRDAHKPTYEYEFDHAIPGQEAQGAVHSDDLPYVFGYFPAVGNLSGPFGPIDKHLAELVQTYWTNFAETGNPNSAVVPAWPMLDKSQSYLIFTEDGQAVPSKGPLRGQQCDLYRKVLEQKMNALMDSGPLL